MGKLGIKKGHPFGWPSAFESILLLDLQSFLLDDDQHDHTDSKNGDSTNGDEQAGLGGSQNFGGIVFDGKIWEGFNGCASEPGHVIVEAEGRACTCGNRGCLEAYCSATAIIRESRRAMERCPDSIMWRLSDGLDGVTGKTAFDAAKRGDFAARAIVDSFIRYLAIGIINIVNICCNTFLRKKYLL